MEINIIIYGKLCETLGESIKMPGVADTNRLTELLNEKFPSLAGTRYVMAVNKKIVKENTVLSENCTVALLPPFSGG